MENKFIHNITAVFAIYFLICSSCNTEKKLHSIYGNFEKSEKFVTYRLKLDSLGSYFLEADAHPLPCSSRGIWTLIDNKTNKIVLNSIDTIPPNIITRRNLQIDIKNLVVYVRKNKIKIKCPHDDVFVGDKDIILNRYISLPK